MIPEQYKLSKKGSSNRFANMEEGNLMGSVSRQRATRNYRLLRKEKLANPRDEPLNWLNNIKWPVLKS